MMKDPSVLGKVEQGEQELSVALKILLQRSHEILSELRVQGEQLESEAFQKYWSWHEHVDGSEFIFELSVLVMVEQLRHWLPVQ